MVFKFSNTRVLYTSSVSTTYILYVCSERNRVFVLIKTKSELNNHTLEKYVLYTV